uniref:Uncharacterized protein n=1 Tax=Chromera velia CCMP2878 TaxID=1169474 RepID=A0A0G4HWE4_9ALVE|eukprot:Cvel_9042.t1-p1 / transcript=Cvel_9042.t1 / gene=Cvel_9042 / organism=Chromera_velia_CCMP2878 / gene_product=hypothetical protein / transcript_product=hypothetical protein / location=Cvel_scaffold512:49726-53346(-) / protein_length=495 / sequence_SO=supercontig / SO=protein_coding / is_pseudo=false
MSSRVPPPRSVPSGGARNLPAAAEATVKVKKAETGGSLDVYLSETSSSSAVQMLGPYPMLSPPLERGGAAEAQGLSKSGGVQAYSEQEVIEIEQLEEEVTALLKELETLNFTQVGLKAEIKKFDETSDEFSEGKEDVSQLMGAALEEAMKKSLVKQKAAKQRKKEMKGKMKPGGVPPRGKSKSPPKWGKGGSAVSGNPSGPGGGGPPPAQQGGGAGGLQGGGSQQRQGGGRGGSQAGSRRGNSPGRKSSGGFLPRGGGGSGGGGGRRPIVNTPDMLDHDVDRDRYGDYFVDGGRPPIIRFCGSDLPDSATLGGRETRAIPFGTWDDEPGFICCLRQRQVGVEAAVQASEAEVGGVAAPPVAEGVAAGLEGVAATRGRVLAERISRLAGSKEVGEPHIFSEEHDIDKDAKAADFLEGGLTTKDAFRSLPLPDQKDDKEMMETAINDGYDEFGAPRNYIIPFFIHNIEQAPVLVRNALGGALFIPEEDRTRTPAWEA